MLHDNLITENFLHHVQKEQSLSPPQSNSSTKMNLYHSLRYEQMQHHLINQQFNNNNNINNQNQKQQSQHHNQDGDEVLDLSRRCNSNVDSTSLTKTPSSSPITSSYQNSTLSPTTINLENHRRKSISPAAQQISNHHTEISASLLAENLQKFYCQQNLLPSKSILSNASLLHNTQSTQLSSSSLPLSMYPVYYPQVKQEPIDTINHHNHQKPQKDMDIPVISPRNTLLQIPQPISIHNNLLLSSSSNVNYPNVQQNLSVLPNLSPKSSLKPDSTDIDRMSDVSSIPGSPSSTTSIIYPKLLNSSNCNSAATIMQNLNSSSVVGDHVSNNNNNNNNGSKPTRPFKAFPRDPLVIAANFAATDVLYDNPRVERYTEYRKRVLEQIRSANGGERTISNPKMRRLNTRNNFNSNNHNNNNSTNISSDGSYSDSQANNSETEDRANDSFSDNDTICNNKSTNYDLNSNSNDDGNLNNNNNDDIKSKNKEKNNNNCNGLDNQHNMIKDAAYYERRRKNNAAAKKSRDRRRIKEDEIAIRAAYLERQNIELLCQLDALKAQLAALTKVQV